MGIIMTYSINDVASFQSLENWLRQIKTHASENVVKILVGNKCDVTDRKVSYEQAKKIAEQFGVQYFEVSAKENRNISEMFNWIATQIKNKILNSEIPIQPKPYTFIKRENVCDK